LIEAIRQRMAWVEVLWEQFSRTLRPRHTSRLGRSSLFIQLILECGLDSRHVQLGLGPADHQLRCQVSVGDDVAFRLLQADGAVGGADVGAVVGGNGVVDGEDDAVSRGALKVGDGPGVGGGHGGVVVGSGVDYAASRATTRARSC